MNGSLTNTGPSEQEEAGAGEHDPARPDGSVEAEAPRPGRRSAPEASEPPHRRIPRRPRTFTAPVPEEPATPPAGGEASGPAGPVDFLWYVLRVQSGREESVANSLRKKLTLLKFDDRVRQVAVPKQKVTEIKEGKKRIKAQKVFPGYIFLEMALDDDLWYLLRDTGGIGDFVGSQQKPLPMTSAEVRKIMDIMEEKEEPKEVKIDLQKHDAVKIKEGPFENFDGVVEEVNPARGIVRVMVSIFGRSTPVDLEYWQVEKL